VKSPGTGPATLDHPMFDGVDRAALEVLFASVQPRRFDAGEVVTMPDGPPRLHLVLDGLLRCYRLSWNGQQLLLELIPPGGFDGLVRLAGLAGHYTVAVQPSWVASIPRRALDRAIASHARFASNLVWASATRLAVRERQMEAIAQRGGVAAVATLLVLLAERSAETNGKGTYLPPRLTHQAMAEMLGLRRETVTTAMRQLKAHKAVAKVGGRYAVDTEALLELSGA
jgi:CRP-like cAMP-binding protein